MVRQGSFALVTLVVAGLLAACGGSTGSGSGAIGPVPDDGYAYPPSPTEDGAGPPPPAEPGLAPAAAAYALNPSLRLTGYETVHRRGILGEGVTVAVVDTGVAPHEQLGARLLDGIDVHTPSTLGRRDVEGHGTHVAGLVAAAGQERGPVGLAPAARILPVRIFDDDGYASAEHLWQGVQATAGRDVRIYNLSLGGRFDHPDLRRTLDWIRDRDRLAVVAAGNFGWSAPGWPAAHAADYQGEVLAVGAVDAGGRLAGASNAAGDVKERYLVAPGMGLVSLAPDGGTAEMSGTSMAAGVVSGVAALVWGHWPHLTARDVGQILLETAIDLGAPGTDEVYGRGLVSAERALQPLGPMHTPTPAGGGVPAGQPLAVLPGGAHVEAGDIRVAYLDRYRRDFYLPLAATVVEARPVRLEARHVVSEALERHSEEVVRSWGGAAFRGLRADAGAGGPSRFELTFSSGLRVYEGRRYLPGYVDRSLAFQGELAQARGLGWWSAGPGPRLGFELGQVRTRDGMELGYASAGAASSWSPAVGVGLHVSALGGAGRQALALQGSIARRLPAGGEVLVQLDAQRLRGGGLARWRLEATVLSLAWEAADILALRDRLRLQLATTLRDGRGFLHVNAATGLDDAGRPVFSDLRLPLAQPATTRLQADYVVPIDARRSWLLTSRWAMQHGTPARGAIVVQYRQRF